MSVFTTQIDVRFRDIDAMGHVNHVVFFTYFEEGRKKFFFDFFKTSDPSAFPFIMAHVGCDYLRPINLGSEPVLQMWVKDIGTKSFNLGYKLVDASDENRVYAKGESVQVCYDYAQSNSMEVPEGLRQKLKEYQIPDS